MNEVVFYCLALMRQKGRSVIETAILKDQKN